MAVRSWTLISLLALALMTTGCRKTESAPVAEAPASEPAATSAPAEDPEESAAAMEILVNKEAVARAHVEPTYVQDPKVPTGKISGVCRFVGKGKLAVPPAEPIDFATGPYAIKDPQPGEVDYYKNSKAAPFRYLDLNRGVAPGSTVLMFREVKRGPREPLKPSGFQAIFGTLRCISGSHGDANITFSPPNAFATLFTWESFSADFLLVHKSTGKVVFSGSAAYKDTGKEKSQHDAGDGHTIWIASEPKPVQTKLLTEKGLYELSLPRHPWKKGYLWVVEHPYVQVVNGSFELGGIPVGKHTIDVWHPAFTPLKQTIELEVKKDETAEMAVEFELPEWLAAERK